MTITVAGVARPKFITSKPIPASATLPTTGRPVTDKIKNVFLRFPNQHTLPIGAVRPVALPDRFWITALAPAKMPAPLVPRDGL